MHPDIDSFLKTHSDELITLRRWFHQYPELAFKEHLTSNYIVSYLTQLGIKDIKIEANTGVICEIGAGSPVIACRFNMDGLPIKEETNLEFQSQLNGYSHSCGHDFELAWGLSIAKYFQNHKPKNKLRILFQPAEEDSGSDIKDRTGGQLFAEQGLFDVNAIFSLHIDPEVPLNTVNIAVGEVTCAAYDFIYKIKGISCHAAKPHLGINPIQIASKLVLNLTDLQIQLMARITDEEGFIVISPTIVHSNLNENSTHFNDSINTIPEVVTLQGIVRVRSKNIEESLLESLYKIKEAVQGESSVDLKVVKRAPATINDGILVDLVKNACYDSGLKVISKRTTWRDDAGWASERAPTVHAFLGVGGGTTNKLHSSEFCPNEDALKPGLQLLITSLNNILNK